MRLAWMMKRWHTLRAVNANAGVKQRVRTGRALGAPACASLAVALASLVACDPAVDFDPTNPARGPGQLVGNGAPVSDGAFVGGNDTLPVARNVAAPLGESAGDCDQACRTYCDALPLQNPVHRGLCPVLWGVGLAPRPIAPPEACRRLYLDMVGRQPSAGELASDCIGQPWGDVVTRLMATDDFVLQQQRLYADVFLYDTQSASVEAIFDLDELVGKLHRGTVAYDRFAAVAASHPAFLRRFATSEDIAEAVYTRFMGRPPFDFERADVARMYQVWRPAYIDHVPLGMRLPDAFVSYPCVDAAGEPDATRAADCTSTLFGLNQVILRPDYRTAGVLGERRLWQGLITPEEWHLLQTPGRAMATQPVFWEAAVDRVLQQYLGYDLAAVAPEVRSELVEYLLRYNGDLRAAHYAVATSVAYLQSSLGETPQLQRWTAGPRKQLLAETWLHAVGDRASVAMPQCDHRVTRPEEFIDRGSATARALIAATRWKLRDDGRVQMRYADLVRSLGGCPTNGADARFRVVSILTTSTQLGVVAELCAPSGDPGELAIAATDLLPAGVAENQAMTSTLATTIGTHVSEAFLGRAPSVAELDEYASAGTACAEALCTAGEFARVACFGVLSSAELLFY